jgi:DNA-binding PadR family transcriptional regulator
VVGINAGRAELELTLKSAICHARRKLGQDHRMGDGDVHLTELEGVILGIVSSRQPCTTYVVQERFERSPTWGWSRSKGAVYPAVARLVLRGLLHSERQQRARRRIELLRLSEAGHSALVAWLLALTPGMGSAPVDPIRARANYLASLNPDQRLYFVEQAEAATKQALRTTKKAIPDPAAADSWALEATYLGVQMQVEAKLRWLRKLRKAITPDN